MEADNAGMFQAAEHADLAKEGAIALSLAADSGMMNFGGIEAAGRLLPGEIDGPHSTLAQFADDLIAMHAGRQVVFSVRPASVAIDSDI